MCDTFNSKTPFFPPDFAQIIVISLDAEHFFELIN